MLLHHFEKLLLLSDADIGNAISDQRDPGRSVTVQAGETGTQSCVQVRSARRAQTADLVSVVCDVCLARGNKAGCQFCRGIVKGIDTETIIRVQFAERALHAIRERCKLALH